MTGHGAKLGRKQEEATLALLTNRTIEDAARQVGVAPKTLVRWLKLPAFQAAYRDARWKALSHSISRLQQGSGVAVSVLLKMMLDPATPPSTRIRAADSVLNHAAKSTELEIIEARVAALEESAVDSEPNNRN